MTKDNTIAKAVCRTPCGLLLLGAVEGRLCLCTWLDESENDVNEYETEAVQQASADTRVLQDRPSAMPRRHAVRVIPRHYAP